MSDHDDLMEASSIVLNLEITEDLLLAGVIKRSEELCSHFKSAYKDESALEGMEKAIELLGRLSALTTLTMRTYLSYKQDGLIYPDTDIVKVLTEYLKKIEAY
jgi:hypothetical protein